MQTLRVFFHRFHTGGRSAGGEVRFITAPAVRANESADGVVWLQIEDGMVFRANAFGRRIWRGLVDGEPRDTIIGELCREFGATRDQVLPDVAEFIGELETRRLVQRVG